MHNLNPLQEKRGTDFYNMIRIIYPRLPEKSNSKTLTTVLLTEKSVAKED